MAYINFLSSEQFSDRLFILTEGYSMVHRFTIGVIIGDEKILVVDAGLGMTGELRHYIEGIVGTDKPMICVCTSGRADHIGAACLFDEAYLNKADADWSHFGRGQKDPFDPIYRYMQLVDYGLESNIVMDYCREHMIPDNHVKFEDIADGQIFDLGGVKIEAIALPGSTPGSMMFYNAEEKYCFTGEAINTDVHLTDLGTAQMAQYAENVKRAIGRMDPDTVLYPYHLPLPMTMEVAKNLIPICTEIAEGKITMDPPAESIFHGYKNDRNVRGHYINNTCVVYDRSKLDGPLERLKFDDICYYSHEKWSDRIYTVTINYSTVNRITLMVFIGDEKILVIDNGHGIDTKLRPYIESFAGKKPMICALTHIGIDHCGGSEQFDEVYIHPIDKEKLPMPRDRRYIDVQPFANYSTEFEEYTNLYTLNGIAKEDAIAIEDGYVFDLGNLKVEGIFTPGHSTGHMSYYCMSEKVCFTGDAMNVDTHLKGPGGRQFFIDYADMIERFLHRVAPDTVLFSSHLNRPNAMRVPRNIQQACLEIAAGQTYGDQPGEAIQQHIGAFHSPYIKMHYHGNCCVVYNTKGL